MLNQNFCLLHFSFWIVSEFYPQNPTNKSKNPKNHLFSPLLRSPGCRRSKGHHWSAFRRRGVPNASVDEVKGYRRCFIRLRRTCIENTLNWDLFAACPPSVWRVRVAKHQSQPKFSVPSACSVAKQKAVFICVNQCPWPFSKPWFLKHSISIYAYTYILISLRKNPKSWIMGTTRFSTNSSFFPFGQTKTCPPLFLEGLPAALFGGLARRSFWRACPPSTWRVKRQC